MKASTALLLGVFGFAPATSSAQFVLFPVSDPARMQLGGVCLGPDGNIWFTVDNRVGRMTPAGVLTEFELPTAGSRPRDIVAGPDGNLWFLESSARRVGRVSPAGAITEYPIPAENAAPTTIVVGPDGALWFSDFIRDSVWRMSLSGSFTEYPAAPASAYGLTVGSDQNLWFTSVSGFPRWIGRMTLSGAVTLFARPPTTSFGLGCALGPDGNVWYAAARGFGRVTPSGAVTEFPIAGAYGHITTAVAAGPDGKLWMPVDESFLCIPPCPPPIEHDGLLRVSTIGVQTRYELAPEFEIGDGSTITAGPAGSMWFTAKGGLVRFYPSDLEGLDAPADIPTLGEIGRVVLVGLLALVGIALLRR